MKKNFTLSKMAKGTLFLSLFLVTMSAAAQITCNNATTIWSEDFGTGTGVTSNPDVLPSLTYYPTGILASESTYRVADNTQQKPEWQISGDHTGNTDGRMLVVNGEAETFYQHTVTDTHGFTPGDYTVSLYIMNVDTAGICAPNPLLPVITFTVEYLSQNNTWVSLTGSPYTAAATQQTVSPTWVNIGSKFTLPETGVFFPTQLRVTLADGTKGGCGNDFALDDINLSLCPAGAPAPVTLVSFSASRKGSGIGIDWTTSQEINNNYFQVLRSADGSTNWSIVSTIIGAGNSQVVHHYNSFDATPLAGVNYYRLKQVDNDGKLSYSKIVAVKMDQQRMAVSVLANPFYNSLTVNFDSEIPQLVTARLVDITGREVAAEKWSLTNGTNQRTFVNVNNLQHGMYVLSIVDNSGAVLFNGKVVKQ